MIALEDQFEGSRGDELHIRCDSSAEPLFSSRHLACEGPFVTLSADEEQHAVWPIKISHDRHHELLVLLNAATGDHARTEAPPGARPLRQGTMRGIPRTEAFSTSDGCDIAFTLRPADVARSPRLVLIHPLGLDGTIWNEVARQLNGRVELLTYDCRGHGSSGRPAMPFTTDLFACDLAQLLDHLDWPIVTLAGCSMGGCVAQAFAARYPLRVNGLGLIDTTAWYGADAPQKWRDRIATVRAKGLRGMLEFQTQRWFSDAFRQQQPATVSRIFNILLRNDAGCYAATCSMLGDTDLRGFQSSIRVPVAVVVGEEDYATPVAMSQQICAAMPGSTLKVLPGVRHLAPVEAPEQVSLQLLALLDRIGPKNPDA